MDQIGMKHEEWNFLPGVPTATESVGGPPIGGSGPHTSYVSFQFIIRLGKNCWVYTVSAGGGEGLPHCTESAISILNQFPSIRWSS